MATRLPNILYLHSHDTGRCMEPYGFPVAMPAYLRLAATGLTFRQAFSAAPTCSPSRAALLTGMTPHESGMMGLAHRGFDLCEPSHHLAAFLASNGYRTVLAGHQHLTRHHPHALGYDTVFESGPGYANIVATNAVAFLDQLGNDDIPFFLDAGFDETHRPFADAADDAGNVVAVLPGLPDAPEIRQDVARFHASISALDRGVGMILDALDSAGRADDTIVILTTDHGPPFPGMKATLTDAGIGVGLIARTPQMKAAGTVTDALVSQIDLFPTLCELANLSPPTWLQGTSLCSLLNATALHVRTEIFGEVTFHAAYEPQRAIRTDRWTYIRRFDDRDELVRPNVDESPTLQYLLARGFSDRPVPSTSLFDNVLDPLQKQSLAGMASVASIEESLANRLETWMRETSDPLLQGSVALPYGAKVNRVSDRSPDDPLVDEDFC